MREKNSSQVFIGSRNLQDQHSRVLCNDFRKFQDLFSGNNSVRLIQDKDFYKDEYKCVCVCVIAPVDHQGSVEDRPVMASPMMLVESFLFALTSANKDGRVVMEKQGKLLH